MELKETEAKPTYSKTIKLWIDADSLIYRAAHAGEKEHREEEEQFKAHPLFEEMAMGTMFDKQRAILHSMIDGIVWKVRADLNLKGVDIEEYFLVFTPKKKYCDEHGLKINFRYGIIDDYNYKAAKENLERGNLSEDDIFEPHPAYKASRKGMPLPEGIPELFDYVGNPDNIPNAVFSDNCEADDVVFREKVEDLDGVVIACLDKDIYMGTPGGELGHYNFNKNEWIYTTTEEANLFFYRQCMTGDSSDGIKGIFRYGPKAAEKDLPEWTNHEDMWKTVLARFIDKGYTEDYAILMMRLVNLNQLTSEGKIELWEPLYGWED